MRGPAPDRYDVALTIAIVIAVIVLAYIATHLVLVHVPPHWIVPQDIHITMTNVWAGGHA